LPCVEVISTGRNVELAAMLANLTARRIGRLFAEGGTMIHTYLTSRRSDLVQYLKSR
jgi:riboflavin biosynthesis pyrimidine reductase